MSGSTAYQCMNCGHFTISKFDGRVCAKCGGPIMPQGSATIIDSLRIKSDIYPKRVINIYVTRHGLLGGCPTCGNPVDDRFNQKCCGICETKLKWGDE